MVAPEHSQRAVVHLIAVVSEVDDYGIPPAELPYNACHHRIIVPRGIVVGRHYAPFLYVEVGAADVVGGEMAGILGIAFGIHHVLPHQVHDNHVVPLQSAAAYLAYDAAVVAVVARIAVVEAQTVQPIVVQEEGTVEI